MAGSSRGRRGVLAGAGVLIGLASVATGAGCASAAPGGPEVAVVVKDPAGHEQVRPGQVTLAAADGNDAVTGIRWSRWDARTAVGHGVHHKRTCTPSCATGRDVSEPATITLDRPAGVPHKHFTHAVVTGRHGSEQVRLP